MLAPTLLLTIVLWAVFFGALRVAVVPPEDCGLDDVESISAAAEGANQWIQRAMTDDGSYVYLFYPERNEIPNDYNEVRHAGTTMAIYQAAGRLADPGALETGDAALAWMTERLVHEDGWSALPNRSGRLSLGATALMTASLAERRYATGDETYDPLMRELGDFMVGLQREDGGFYIAREADGEIDTVNTSRYYPGEAFFALMLLHKAFPDEDWLEPARRAADFLTLKRDEVENVDFPPLADQWTAYGLGELADVGLEPHHVDYARRLAERFGFLVRQESQKEGSWYGRIFRGGDDARASGVGTWEEALGALWRASQKDPRLEDLAPKIEERLQCVGGIMADRQTTAEEARQYARPDLAEGAWIQDDETRADDQQHAFSGLLYTLDALDGRVQREPEEPPFSPSGPSGANAQ